MFRLLSRYSETDIESQNSGSWFHRMVKSTGPKFGAITRNIYQMSAGNAA